MNPLFPTFIISKTPNPKLRCKVFRVLPKHRRLSYSPESSPDVLDPSPASKGKRENSVKRKLSLYLMAAFYTVAGLNHFRNPDFYMVMMPPYLPWHLELIYLSGAIEILLGLALLSCPLRRWAAWGVIALLIAIFPANIHHLMVRGGGMDVPVWALWVRLPFQLVFIWWAYTFTKPEAVTR